MNDILLECAGALSTAIILWVLTYNMGLKSALELPGSRFILAGFALFFLGMLLDITDNFPALNHFVVIGNTQTEAFLEKVVGTSFGLVFMSIGFYQWLPCLVKLRETQNQLKSLNEELDERVQKRTQELESSNERLQHEVCLREISENKLKKLALYDGLTDLPNRMLALDRLTQEILTAKREKTKVAVLFLDIDDFKKVNDLLGHEIGDKFLCKVAKRLSAAIRSSDTLARYGGDEFIVILDGISDDSDINPIVEKLLRQFCDAYQIDGHELITTLSIGVSVYPDDGESGEELLDKADSAMYHAKKAGRNTYSYFTEQMNAQIARRVSLEAQMHGALERGEFAVYYQPKINISNNKITGTEALLRWSNPALGNIAPAEFITIAEQTGKIIELGEFVLKTAIRDTVELQTKYAPDLTVSVNLSPRQFRDLNLVNFIENTIKQNFFPARCLELEITEGVLLNGYEHLDNSLKRLNQLGVNIAMDDFGTGYSSLSYLRKFPFNVLKIDKSFVNEITFNASDRTLIKAAVAMAHGLNLRVVAEGVETAEQFSYIKELGCDYVQGYFFSKPITFAEMELFLQSHLLDQPQYAAINCAVNDDLSAHI
jgi:diguanylate cyclase (GGDEF)-like protein